MAWYWIFALVVGSLVVYTVMICATYGWFERLEGGFTGDQDFGYAPVALLWPITIWGAFFWALSRRSPYFNIWKTTYRWTRG